jgi:uncharacterized protein (TIGR03437 family)
LTARVTGLTPATVTFEFTPSVSSDRLSGLTGPDSTGLTKITYTAPSPITSKQTISVTARAADGTAAVPVTITLVPVTISVTVTPSTATLNAGQSARFTAAVLGTSQTGVTWSYSPQVGSLSVSGTTATYTAPGQVSASQKITITATSTFDNSTSDTATVTVTQLVTVGGGAPSDALTVAFLGAWNRNGFNALVTLPPVGLVRPFGNTGYVQEFTDATTSTLRHALVTGSASLAYGGISPVFQVLGPLWSYYSTVGANTAGYPLSDSQTCSALGTSCVWDLFDKNYALFAYSSTLPNGFGPNFSVNGTFYTEWTALGAMNGPGSPVSAQTANVTAPVIAPATTATTATVQTYARGAIYSITNNANRGKIFGVMEPIYDLYISQSGPSGSLGMPTSEAYQYAAGVYRQNFEGGVLQAGGGGPAVLFPVTSVALSGAQAGAVLTLNVGQTVTLTATPMTGSGDAAPDRAVSWSGTNGKVVSIVASGATAVITAVGAGAASVQAASQGVSSAKVNFIVIAPCCQVGEGAPSAVQQAFQDALTRNRITVQSPLAAPAERLGTGYVQTAQSADGKTTYLLAESDRLGAAYVVTGALLAKYQALGGPAGVLGYPAGDASAGGTQLFANGSALGGSPVRQVGPPIVTKWALLGYENGAAGAPTTDASPFSTFGANSGAMQRFTKGTIYGATSGPRAGQAYLTAGLIQARYEALGGAAGDYGMPVSDDFATGALRQQNFEGGSFTYSNGDTAAVEHPSARAPGIVVSPTSVSAGGQARIAILGFPNNSTLKISVAGSPDFTVTTTSGAYSWDMAIGLAARSGAVAIHAADGKGASADGTLTVKGFADNRIQIVKLQGDNQVGLPGSALPLSLRVGLVDAANAPVAGAPVTFVASAGIQLSAASAVSDSAGRVEVFVRLSETEGVGAITVSSPSIAQAPATFYVRAAAGGLANFPAFAQSGATPLGNGTASIASKGALLTAVASILRYHQNRGDVPAPSGVADPVQLNQFLKTDCGVDARGNAVCDGFLSNGSGSEQVVNLWRAADFTGALDVAPWSATSTGIADVLAAGSPALLSLALSRNGVPAGGHFVVAVGVASDGSIVIQDPNLFFGRANLNDYLGGFSAGGAAWSGELRSVVQFALRSPSATRFLLGAVSQAPDLIRSMAMEAQSTSGSCGTPIDLGDAVDGSGSPSGGLVTRLRACDGSDPVYQIAIGAAQPYRAFLTDLASGGSTLDLSGSAPAVYQLTRSRLNVVLAPQTAGFAANAVVNGATFAPGIAPGGIFSIFGSGLAGAGSATTVTVDGVAATVLLASPFQVNAVVPASIGPGMRTVEVRSAYGVASQSVLVSDLAPGIFLMAAPDTGAVVNYENGTLNGPTAPLTRGQTLVVYGTGLGAVVDRGGYSETTTPVVVVLNGVGIPAGFAGLTPGYSGLYQVNVTTPGGTPPGLGISLTLQQGAKLSNTVRVAVQ